MKMMPISNNLKDPELYILNKQKNLVSLIIDKMKKHFILSDEI